MRHWERAGRGKEPLAVRSPCSCPQSTVPGIARPAPLPPSPSGVMRPHRPAQWREGPLGRLCGVGASGHALTSLHNTEKGPLSHYCPGPLLHGCQRSRRQPRGHGDPSELRDSRSPEGLRTHSSRKAGQASEVPVQPWAALPPCPMLGVHVSPGTLGSFTAKASACCSGRPVSSTGWRHRS